MASNKRKTDAKRARKKAKLIVRHMRDEGKHVNRKIIKNIRLDLK